MENHALRDKAYQFAIRVVKLTKILKEEHREFDLSKQLVRAGTSIGANLFEAKHAQSRADFRSKMNISLKEASETQYWLCLLKDTGYLNESEFSSIHSDCSELTAMLVSALKKLKEG